MTIQNSEKITVVTTHANADFDAMASMLAAQKLYPEAILILPPGSRRKTINNFFLDSTAYLLNMKNFSSIKLEDVGKLILVDTRQKKRIGELAKALDNPGIEVHIYDHHPAGDNDAKGDFEMISETGANVSQMVQLLKEREIPISAEEATLMILGIYEDTGAFTFESTTVADFEAAAYLLSKRALLSVVSDVIVKEMTSSQVNVLNDLAQSAETLNINGVSVVIAEVITEDYVNEFAMLVQKMSKMKNANTVFAIAQMGNKTYIVARCRADEVDAGEIMAEFGGGGHAFAASATIKDQTLVQIKAKLVSVLHQKIRARRTAIKLMSSPAITITPDTTCHEAQEVINRYNINAVLVTEITPEGEKLKGYITRQIIEKLRYHHLDDLAVSEYMTTDIAYATPESDLEDIQAKIIDNNQRILPVMSGTSVLGVITRTDLLHLLISKQERDNDPSLVDNSNTKTRNVVQNLSNKVSQEIFDYLKTAGEVADEIGYKAYVVGGFVRDIIMNRKNEDVDIVIEGNGITFAKEFAARYGARIHTYPHFGTSVVIMPDGFKLDVATARMEYYLSPAALPTVESSSIKMDLFRRDFTINTLAIQLNSGNFGVMIDFFSGQKDIKDKVIRVLHNLSFVEDPTRVFRAIRFEQRFKFSIGKMTESLIENAVTMEFFKSLSGYRVFHELRHIFEEEDPPAALNRMADFNLLSVIDPKVQITEKTKNLLDDTKEVLTWFDLLYTGIPYQKWIAYMLVLTRDCTAEEIEAICDKFKIVPKDRNVFATTRRRATTVMRWLEGKLPQPNSVIYRNLCNLPAEQILSMMAMTNKDSLKKAISLYFTSLSQVRTTITGKDIQKTGLKQGPVYGQILDAVLDAKLDDLIITHEDELRFMRDYITEYLHNNIEI